MMTECVQNEQDENDDQDASQEPPQKRRQTVDENDAQCICREVTVGLDAQMQDWDGCMRQHGVGIMIVAMGWGLGKFLKIQ